MLKNLSVTSNQNYRVNKAEVHRLVFKIKKELNFVIAPVNINFITSEEIISINKTFLKHDYSTDIITFNYSEENYTLDGEIFISLDDAYENSKKYKVSLDEEVVRLVIHGFLHLVGYDDILKEDQRIMKKEENRLVKKFQNNKNKIILKYDS